MNLGDVMQAVADRLDTITGFGKRAAEIDAWRSDIA